MKKSYLLLSAVALVMLGSCSDDAMNISMDEALATKDVPVSFGTYTGKSATTRAGDTTPMTTTVMQTTGFGVFAYNTGSADYATGATPNFMYNQKVSGSSWSYEPVKYWPNLKGATDDQSPAASEANGPAKLSFFAYAPYVDLTATGADLTNNIVEMIAADGKVGTNVVDPYIKYMYPADGKSVDLLWGTADPTNTTGPTAINTAQTGKIVNSGIAKVNADLQKQKNTGKVSFFFKHALSNIGGSATTTNSSVPNPNSDETGTITVKQGGFQAVLDINDDGTGTSDTKASTTVVTIKNIKIKGKNLAPTGTTGEDENGDPATSDGTYVILGGKLNLVTGVWTKIMKTTPAATDGVIDHNVTSPASSAAETAVSNGELSEVLAEPASITAATQWSSLPKGVLTVPQNVYKTETNPMVFMPGSKPSLEVEVEYIVRTKDDKLADGWTVVEQKVTKGVDFPVIDMNKKYNLIMRIGLTDVKFTATVEDWAAFEPDPTDPNSDGVADPSNPDDPDNNDVVDIEVFVPKNVN